MRGCDACVACDSHAPWAHARRALSRADAIAVDAQALPRRCMTARRGGRLAPRPPDQRSLVPSAGPSSFHEVHFHV